MDKLVVWHLLCKDLVSLYTRIFFIFNLINIDISNYLLLIEHLVFYLFYY